MARDDGFVRDILAHPDDDTPRLVYADWLDDHGDGDRAAFLRVQCELAKLPPNDARQAELRRRERELLRLHQETWLAPLPPWSRSGSSFKRGFVETVNLTARQFVRQGAKLFQSAPAGCPALACLEGLDLSKNRIGDAGAQALVESPHLGDLKVLSLHSNPIRKALQAALRARFGDRVQF